MKKKDVIINIVDSHEIDGQTERMELNTIGTFEGSSQDYTLHYSEDGDMEGCEVSLNVKEKRCVTMTRTGAFQTQLIMEQGKRHNCHYMTPAGEMMLGVFAKRVRSDVNENGGLLEFNYTIDFNAGFVSANDLKITVTQR